MSRCVAHPASALALFALCMCLALTRQAQSPAALDQPVQASWEGAPLREALQGLAKSQRLTLLLDRRVDPGRPLTASLSGPLRGELERLAAEQKLGVALVGSVLCVGPAEAVERFPTLVTLRKQELSKLPAAVRTGWLKVNAAGWNDLATPRELLEQIAKDGKFDLAGHEAIPHDLWAGAELPPLGIVERLTLVAGQFDLTFVVEENGAQVRLVPIPATVARAKLPAASGTVKKGADPAATQRFKLNVKNNPIGKVLRELSPKLGLELQLDSEAIAAAGVSLDALVSFEVQDATLDELLEAMTKPAGLAFRRNGKQLEVFPRKAP
jgi:hypothetical protein